ncbi:MAG: hypothetical protein AAGH68_08185 [Pseudomonadota bacterium]
MSFDLLFHAPGGQSVSKGRLDRWFAKQPHCTVLTRQADYDNPDTGVHFMWEYSGDVYGTEGPAPHVILLLNYLRPLPFADEAADIIDALVAKFGFLVSNPQDDGKPEPWNRAAFLASYRQHAGMAARSLLHQHPDAMQQLRILPSERIRRIWDWNRQQVERYQWLATLGLDLFIPKVMVLEVQGTVYETFIWGDAVPCIIPPGIDHVLLGREALAPRTGLLRKRRATHELVPLSALKHILDAHYMPLPEIPGALRARRPADVPELRAALQARPAGKDAINRAIFPDKYDQVPEADRMAVIAFSSLLDAELVSDLEP